MSKVFFDFPILHGTCDECRDRFRCMTMKIHNEWDVSCNGHQYKEKFPFRIGLSCIRFSTDSEYDTYVHVRGMCLHLDADGIGMILEASII